MLGSKNTTVEKKSNAFPFLVLAVTVMITIGVTYNFYHSAKNKDFLRFQNETTRIQSEFENRLNLYLSLLKGGRGFVESVPQLNRENFSDYVKSLELDKNYAGIQGIGFSKKVLPGQREKLIKLMKTEGFNDFKLFPSGDREIYQTVVYIEPLDERNEKSIGYDMSTESNRREALDRARDTGKAAATAKVTLLQQTPDDLDLGFLIYLPVYKSGRTPPTTEGRREALIGYIYSPFKAESFLREIQNNSLANSVGIKIYDGDIDPNNLLAQTSTFNIQKLTEKMAGNQFFSGEVDGGYESENNLAVAGKTWKIKYSSLPNFNEQSSVGWTPLIFFGGVAFSFLLFGMTYWEASARRTLENTTANLYESERQREILLENEHQARLSAEKANATKDEFIAVVSHELKTPLNAIAGWSRILKTETLSESTKELALLKIEKNIRTQTKLVEDLLDYSQILAGNSNFAADEIEIFPVVENSLNGVQSAAVDKNIEIIRNNQLNGQKIIGDEEKLAVALQNLLMNALKFTESGGRVEVSVFEDNNEINIKIRDNGRGIGAEFLPHIFERFRQADNSITRDAGGLGLGLSISNQIVRMHQGYIYVESEGEGKGSVFTVKIPSTNSFQNAPNQYNK